MDLNYPEWKGILNRKVLFLLSVLILVFLTSGCITRSEIPSLIIGKKKYRPSYPFGNLTRTDISSIPVLTHAIDEVLASSSMDQKVYEISQEEWDQIAQLFDELNLPPQHEGDTSWYVFFEGTFLAIYLGYIAVD